MTDMTLPWIPRFEYGDEELRLQYPVTLWSQGGRTSGIMRRTSTQIPGSSVTLRKYTLTFSLRFFESEWPLVRALILFGQSARSFTWFPMAIPGSNVSYEVFLDAPRVKTPAQPRRDSLFPSFMSLPITLTRADREPWAMEYIGSDEVLPPPPTLGVAYLVTFEGDGIVEPSAEVEITAQLVNAFDDPILEAGHTVTWSSTGAGGSFDSPTSITDVNGIATVVFTAHSVLGEEHTVTATDENAITGTSDEISVTDDGLQGFRDIGDCELLIDVIMSVSASGGVVTAVVDRSGNNNPCSVPGGGNAPVYNAAGWDATHPAIQMVEASGEWLNWTTGAVPQPYTYVFVMDGYCATGAGNQNVGNGGTNTNNGGISYRAAGGSHWSMYGGAVLNTGLLTAAGTGKVVRFDLWDGATSQSFRGATGGTVGNAGTLAISAGNNGLGARTDGVDPSSVKIGMFLVYSKKLSAQDMIDIQALATARYPGIGA